jgi:hypothetical protein
MSHTPGPWHYRRGDEWSHSVVTHHGTLPDGSQNCWTVADINKMREPEHEANARLIAAAPDMLEALKRAHTWLQGSEPGRAQYLGEVIAKAEGETT